MKISKNRTERGDLTSVLQPDGRHASVLMPQVDPASPFSKSLAVLNDALGSATQIMNGDTQRYQPTALADSNRHTAVSLLGKPVVALQSVGQDERRATADATARAMAVDPATPATAPARARMAAKFDAADMSGKAILINNGSYEDLAALHENGAVFELPTELRQIATDRYMALRHVTKTGLQANFLQQPDARNPLATGPDVDAATAAALTAVAGLKARSEDIDTIAAVLRNVVSVVAVACDLSTDQAYALLTTGKVAA